MCEMPTNNSLASWDSGMWSKEKKKSCSNLCQEFVSVFAKNWAQSSGLSPCRLAAASQTEVDTQMPANMAPTSCLWLNTSLGFCPPKHNKETQNGVSHIGHFRSAYKNEKVYLSGFFSDPAVSWWRKSRCSIESDRGSISCQALRGSQQTQTTQSITGTE